MNSPKLGGAVLLIPILVLSVAALCLLNLKMGGPLTPDTYAAPAVQATGTPSAPSCGGTISYGSSRTGWIDYPQTTCDYPFSGAAGDIVNIGMNRQGNSLDPYLDLASPNGVVVVSDDDSGGNYNSLISNFSLSQSGTWKIRAHSWNYASTGGFTVSLNRVTAVCGSNISYGSTINGSLPSSMPRRCFYKFQGTSGQRVTITMNRQSSSLDPFLRLQAPIGTIVASDDDSGGNYNSRISSYLLTQSGTYTIIAGSYNDQSYGPYQLTLLRQ